jgi:hypothetical protein
MKIKKLIRKMYLACLKHQKNKQKKLWFKTLKKSLQHKKTQIIQ